MSKIDLNFDEFNPDLFGQTKDDDDDEDDDLTHEVKCTDEDHSSPAEEDTNDTGYGHNIRSEQISDVESSNSSPSSHNSHKLEETGQGKSRNKALKEIRDEIEDDPDLYGIRRSARSRKEPSRFEIQREEAKRKNRIRHLSSSGETDSSGSSGDYRPKRSRVQRRNGRVRTIRTRGNRVSYKEPSSGDDLNSDSDDDSEPRSRKKRRRHRDDPIMSIRPSNKQHPLLGRAARGDDYRRIKEGSQSEDITENSCSETDTRQEAPAACKVVDTDDIHVIEEVVNYRIARKGATGDQTTLYNCREKDPNTDFDSSTEEGELQFFIKWKTWSHIHNTWDSWESLVNRPDVTGMNKLEKYRDSLREIEAWKKHASAEELENLAYEEERNEIIVADKSDIERIVTHYRAKQSDTCDYLIKWKRMEYCFCTWEDGTIIQQFFPAAVSEYEERCKSQSTPNKKCEALRFRPKFVPLKCQPAYIAGGDPDTLFRDYQLDGVNWLARAWTKGKSTILADEMGLGKTIQTIGFLSYLFHEHKLFGPSLLVVPLSTIGSWQAEFATWAPELNVIIYTGNATSRQTIREYEWSFAQKGMIKFNVCITTYEILLKDKAWLGQVSWALLGVDEAHRLKNDASQLYRVLIGFDTNTRLLVTGTPLQNSLRELWALLHFIMPDEFDDWEEFESEFNVDRDNSKGGFNRLHKTLEPYLLRRVKKDVETSLPAKSEQILRVEMASTQQQYYKWILAKNYEALAKEMFGHVSSFINIIMELKKCCNHPHLITRPTEESEKGLSQDEILRDLIKSSGKMILLDKLLLRLKNAGHRVLIFSQMVRMLDIIADYLRLRSWAFQRLDGSIRGDLRKQALDHFNAEGSTDFCFLLSTRAGGLGVNLATADTVIIFDSDWNPQNDLQAQARAHRIGQTKQVSVYRFVIKNSVEEKIIETAKRKMVLDHLVIQRMDTSGKTQFDKKQPFNKDELNQILRFGAENLFGENAEKNDAEEMDIEDILSRAETRDTEAEAERQNPAHELLSQFKVVTLENFDEEEPVYMDSGNRPKKWSDIIPEGMRSKIKEEESGKLLLELELGPRQRRQVRLYRAGGGDVSDEDESSSSEDEKRKTGKMTDKDVRALIKTMKRFARPMERIDSIIAEAEIPERSEKEVGDVVNEILTGCKKAIEQASCQTEPNTAGDESNITGMSAEEHKASGKGPVFQMGRIAIPAKPLLQSIEWLDVLHEVMPLKHEDRLTYKLPFSTKLVNWTCEWDTEDDSRLLVGIYEHGMDNFEAIKMDPELNLMTKILPASSSDRPQSSHLRTRIDYLLKMLKKGNGTAKTPLSVLKPVAPKPKKERDSKKRKSTHQPESSTKPKSKEFIDSSDTSDSSDDSSMSNNKSAGKTAAKAKKMKREAKDDNKTSDEPLAKKRKTKKTKASAGPVHYTANRETDTGTKPQANKAEEADYFNNMKGTIFDSCKEKMRPMRKYIKKLEGADADDVNSGLRVYLLKIGDHINKMIHEFKDKAEVRRWRNYLWFFVNIFTQLSDNQLHQVYKKAFKDRSKSGGGSQDESSKQDHTGEHHESVKHGGHESSKRGGHHESHKHGGHHESHKHGGHHESGKHGGHHESGKHGGHHESNKHGHESSKHGGHESGSRGGHHESSKHGGHHESSKHGGHESGHRGGHHELGKPDDHESSKHGYGHHPRNDDTPSWAMEQGYGGSHAYHGDAGHYHANSSSYTSNFPAKDNRFDNAYNRRPNTNYSGQSWRSNPSGRYNSAYNSKPPPTSSHYRPIEGTQRNDPRLSSAKYNRSATSLSKPPSS